MSVRRFFLPISLISLLIASCQQNTFPIYKGYKMKPYTVNGTRFIPMSIENALKYEATGVASHYEAAGAKGALGQRLYHNQFYAAHRTLPLPCTARVTNLKNGKSCIVRIADRGPFIPGRLIDVSTKTAESLDFKHSGLEHVKVEVLSVGDGPYRRSR